MGTTCLAPAPELTFYQTTHWSRGSLNLSLVWSYIDEVTQEAIVLSGTPASNYALPSLDAQHYFDLLGSYDLSDTWTLRFGITNLLDNDPPVPGNDYGGTTENSGNTYPATYEPPGSALVLWRFVPVLSSGCLGKSDGGLRPAISFQGYPGVASESEYLRRPQSQPVDRLGWAGSTG